MRVAPVRARARARPGASAGARARARARARGAPPFLAMRMRAGRGAARWLAQGLGSAWRTLRLGTRHRAARRLGARLVGTRAAARPDSARAIGPRRAGPVLPGRAVGALRAGTTQVARLPGPVAFAVLWAVPMGSVAGASAVAVAAVVTMGGVDTFAPVSMARERTGSLGIAVRRARSIAVARGLAAGLRPALEVGAPRMLMRVARRTLPRCGPRPPALVARPVTALGGRGRATARTAGLAVARLSGS